MAKFKMYNNINLDPRMERQALKNKYNSARLNLLMAVGFTVVNVLLLAFGGGSYFLFSMTVPYIISMFGLLFCGMMPDELYKEMGLEGMMFLDEGFFYITLAISVLILALYVVCWFFSKKKPVWLKVALGLFIVDTVAMILYYGIAVDAIMDILFHGYVIWILISGINAEKKLRNMPEPEPIIEAEFTDISNDESAASSENQSMTDFDVANAQEQGAEPAESTEAGSATMFQESVHNAELDAPEDTRSETPTEEKTENDDGFSSANGPLDI